MRKLIIMVILLVFFIPSIFAQNYIDVVHLKNGGKIKGVIIEQVLGETVKIETADGSIFVFKVEEIEKLAKEKVADTAKKEKTLEDIDSEEAIRQVESKLRQKMSVRELANLNIVERQIQAISEYQRREIYNKVERDDRALPFVLNLLLPFGIGSFIQGDTDIGIYRAVSDSLAIITVSASALTIHYDTWDDITYSYVFTDFELLMIGLTGFNAGIAAVVSWITPFTYVNRYNDLLKEKLRIY